MKQIIYLVVLINFCACAQEQKKDKEEEKTIHQLNFKNTPFIESDSLVLMNGLSYKVLFSEGDTVLNAANKKAAAKGSHDLVVYLPNNNSSNKGDLFVSHESASTNNQLGHGGGATVMPVENNKGWKVTGDKHNVDFSSVGFTMRNCGGKTTPYGTILMAEEAMPSTKEELIGQVVNPGEVLADTLNENFGWMVEVDPKSKKAIRKITAMGRYVHEDAICLPDNKTVILTNDDSPAVLFKFVADDENDFSKGSLFAYSETGEHWIALPKDLTSLKNIKQIAIQKGATLFVRHEWVTQVGNDIYITETGHDFMQWQNAISLGGKPASYFEKYKQAEGIYSDFYGRVLKLNTISWELSVQLDGGVFGDKECFSNPDCINQFTYGNKNYLVISEDVIGLSNGRVSNRALSNNELYCEVFLLDLSIKKPKLTDLIRLATAPKGSETTGLYFTPDEKTLFMAIQHPDTTNKIPFNKTSVIAITGF